MAKIKSIKMITSLGKRELRTTELDGVIKYDIREWKSDTSYEDGVRFTKEELEELLKMITSNELGIIGNKTVIFEDNQYYLTIENNGRLYKRTIATKEEIDKLLKFMNGEDEEKNAESVKKRRGRPKKNETNSVNESNEQEKKPEEKKSTNIIQFPKQKPEIDKLVTDGNATYEECEAKLMKEKEVFVDSDSQYVIDGLLELCKVDSDFRNNVMLEDKNYQGALQYMMKMAQQGYAYKVANGYSMDRDMGLGFAIDYFNSKPEPKTKKTTKTTKKGK